MSPDDVLHHFKYGWVRLVEKRKGCRTTWLVEPLQRYAGGPAEHLREQCYVGQCDQLSEFDDEGRPYEAEVPA